MKPIAVACQSTGHASGPSPGARSSKRQRMVRRTNAEVAIAIATASGQGRAWRRCARMSLTEVPLSTHASSARLTSTPSAAVSRRPVALVPRGLAFVVKREGNQIEELAEQHAESGQLLLVAERRVE